MEQRLIALVGFAASVFGTAKAMLEERGYGVVSIEPTDASTSAYAPANCALVVLAGSLLEAECTRITADLRRTKPELRVVTLDDHSVNAGQYALADLIVENLEIRTGVFEAVERIFPPEHNDVASVLLVDDDASHLLLRKMLLEAEGYAVLTARSGVEGVQIFRSTKVDVVILDYHMPDLDGGIVAERLKRMNSRVPIIMFSGQALIPPTALRHVTSIVRKGEHPSILLKRIKSALET